MEDVDHRRPAAGFLTGLGEGPAHADVRVDAREELAHPERLGDEVGGAESQRAHRRFLGRHGRHHQHRQIAVALILFEALEQLQAVDLWHHDVEQQQRGLDLFEFGEQPVASGADRDLVPIFLQDPGQGLYQGSVVVGDQHARCGTGHLVHGLEKRAIDIAAADHEHRGSGAGHRTGTQRRRGGRTGRLDRDLANAP